MGHNLYVTEYGEVRISSIEADALRCGAIARTLAPRFPFGRSESAKRVIAKADAIRSACERFAKHRLENNQD